MKEEMNSGQVRRFRYKSPAVLNSLHFSTILRISADPNPPPPSTSCGKRKQSRKIKSGGEVSGGSRQEMPGRPEIACLFQCPTHASRKLPLSLFGPSVCRQFSRQSFVPLNRIFANTELLNHSREKRPGRRATA